MIPDNELLHRTHPKTKALFKEMTELLEVDTVYEAVTQLREAKMSSRDIAEKFDLPPLTVLRVMQKIQPFDLEVVYESMAVTRAERYGLRLLNGTTLLAHCRALGIEKTQSPAYHRERARLVREQQLVTAEEYQRALRFKERGATLPPYERFVQPPYTKENP